MLLEVLHFFLLIFLFQTMYTLPAPSMDHARKNQTFCPY